MLVHISKSHYKKKCFKGHEGHKILLLYLIIFLDFQKVIFVTMKIEIAMRGIYDLELRLILKIK